MRDGKLFLPVAGRPLLAHTLAALERCPEVRWIVLAAHPEAFAQIRALIRRYRIRKALAPVSGGASRAASVAHGVAAVPDQAAWVLIHDGARPCVTPSLIRRAVRAASRYGAVACGLPASLTVKATDAQGWVRLTLDRSQLWFVQTPQVFRRDWLVQALARVQGTLEAFPDDAAVVESSGVPVRMIPGDPLNLKVTTREDLLLAEAILRKRQPVERRAGGRRIRHRRVLASRPQLSRGR